MKVSKRLKREAKEHLKGKFVILFIFILVLSYFAGYYIGKTAASVSICLDYAFRYIESRGIGDLVEADIDRIRFLINKYPVEFNQFVDGNYSAALN